MATREKSELLLLRNSQLPSIPARHWSGPLKMRHRDKLSLGRENTWKLTAAQCMSDRYSEELQRKTEGCRNSKARPSVTVTRTGAQTTQAFFFVEGTHPHWQATAGQFFFRKFNMHTVQQKILSAKNFVKSDRQAVRQEFIFVKRPIARFVFGRSVRLLIVYLHIHEFSDLTLVILWKI